MPLHLLSQAAAVSGKFASRGTPFVAVLALAAQIAAQNPVIPSIADRDDAASRPQQAASPVSDPSPAEISAPAPAPAQEEASLTSSSQTIPFLAIEAGQDNSQSSSSSSSQQATAPPSQPAATKAKHTHRGLGIALAVVGTAAFVISVGAYATVTGPGDLCHGGNQSGNCNAAHTATLVVMPVGGAMAVAGFYLAFH